MLTRTLFALAILSKPFVCVPQAKEAATDGDTTSDTTTGTTATTGVTDTDTTSTTDTETSTTPAVCGNGELEAGEQCDDANDDNTDDCLINCLQASCGDDFVHQGVEECDDGDLLDTNACTSDCKMAFCGDGITWDAMEECDDANTDDTDACTNDCKAPVCGDGILSADELCDLGPSNVPKETALPNDCTTDCRPACGDGTLSSQEECDDMNQTLGDGCTPTCEHEYLMFATKDLFSADLGGIPGADEKCQTAASAANLPGIYVAWLSIENSDASLDLPSGKPLIRTDGLPIVATAADLHKGGATLLMNPIDLAEDASPVTGYAWTGTTSFGAPSGIDCTGWTSAANALAHIGHVSSTSPPWTTATMQIEPPEQLFCDASNHLYCFRTSVP